MNEFLSVKRRYGGLSRFERRLSLIDIRWILAEEKVTAGGAEQSTRWKAHEKYNISKAHGMVARGSLRSSRIAGPDALTPWN
jgi:hypothetical protein